MIARVLLAVLAAAAGALVGGFVSRAIGLHHFWPGVIGSFVITLPIYLLILRRI